MVIMKKSGLISALVVSVLCLTACGAKPEESSSSITSEATDSIVEETKPMLHEGILLADFKEGPSADFYVSAGWSNGAPFDCSWSDSCCTFSDGVMKLTIDKIADGAYRGGEYRTNDFYGFGMYEVSMKAIKNNGVVSSFFTYTGPSDDNPWDEIDIEFLGKDTTKVQFNYYTNGVGLHEYMYDLGFDASEEFHTYGFEWKEDSITWYVDGEAVYTATENLPVTPGRIMMNAWNGKGVDSWLRKFDGTTPLTAEYQWVKFTPEE